MEPSRILPFPFASTERLERDLEEIDAAIAMVAGGMATRMRLVGLAAASEVAAPGLARAQLAGVAFSLDGPQDQHPAIIIGPVQQRSP